MYKVERNTKYDFISQSYSAVYPNIHKYPATMIPQLGIEILKELNIKKGKLLDPYCGSGSSFAAGLENGIKTMYGYDINPLAVLITKGKFTKIKISELEKVRQEIRDKDFEFAKDETRLSEIKTPEYFNVDFWFSKPVLQYLSLLKFYIDKVKNKDIQRLLLIPLSETIRECSYTRNSEFKLFRMKSEDLLTFNPDVLSVYFNRLNKVLDIYRYSYLPHLDGLKINVEHGKFKPKEKFYDIVLTSPPYGDSRTTVAYGQFSHFGNEWLGIDYARKIDGLLMGGKSVKENYLQGVLKNPIADISKEFPKRALEVSSFYFDLRESITDVAKSINHGSKSIYVVGNRRIKGIQLPTDQFIAEIFEQNGFKHLVTYERKISNKVMPSRNSPSNISGATAGTMTQEFIVVCEKS